ncbi:Uncharacterized membrane protein [Poseidonocella pacifica]|uniref:Uncharacterized membrane protein n=1 Tax=Poseidonocella pacifica TaxID=871651 RepID=A0A1I0VAL7_9RHOB|nr:DUF2254 domain-containing protein [Poseidonocella pacifica]SFA73365.1 Uncharacterized membrane protein [Poseidonocella pacifica]
MIRSRVAFIIRRLRSRLWIKPIGYAVAAVGSVFLAGACDALDWQEYVLNISDETIEKLLSVISASMLGVATFAVTSMVSAYASASGRATPRAFALVISDGQTQTALSSFIGAFIFSVVGIIAIRVGSFGEVGRFALFVLTVLIFAWVVLTFVRWVDRIARLGRLGNTIQKVDDAARDAFDQWPRSAPLGARPSNDVPEGTEVFPDRIGFIQHVDMEALQQWAEKSETRVHLLARPGAHVHPERPLLCVEGAAEDLDAARKTVLIDGERSFATDPRFGLIVLSEIASRALSPAVNDPGTAIDIVTRMARILHDWAGKEPVDPECDRVYVAPLNANDLLEDGFAALSKDGVGSVELGIWVQKSLGIVMRARDPDLRAAAERQARISADRAEAALTFEPDRERMRRARAF